MKNKISNPYHHILFWIVVLLMLIFVFGRLWQSYLQSFYFTVMLLPVIMGTSYFFNYYLVPCFLLKKKYVLFFLYLYYVIVISLFLQVLVAFYSNVYLANLEMSEMGFDSINDVLFLISVMYMIVFMSSFFVMLQQLKIRQSEIDHLKEENEKAQVQYLLLTSNRQLVKIPYDDIIYIESLSDYIKVHSTVGKEVVSKEKISVLADKLPNPFIRIHRSFIINSKKMIGFSSSEVEMEGSILNIGRSYKKEVLPFLRSI